MRGSFPLERHPGRHYFPLILLIIHSTNIKIVEIKILFYNSSEALRIETTRAFCLL